MDKKKKGRGKVNEKYWRKKTERKTDDREGNFREKTNQWKISEKEKKKI